MLAAFGKQHIDDLLRAVITEQLPQFLFMIGDAVIFDEADKIIGRIPRQRRFNEMRVA